MIAKAAYIYVCFLFAVAVILMCFCIFLQASALTTNALPSTKFSNSLAFASFLVAFASLGVAKDRNVWKNEFKSCPVWWRTIVLTFMLWGWVSIFVQIALKSDSGFRADQSFIAISASLFFGAAPLCVLYPFLFSDSVDRSEIMRRIPVSVGLTALIGMLFLAGHLGFFPHAGR